MLGRDALFSLCTSPLPEEHPDPQFLVVRTTFQPRIDPFDYTSTFLYDMRGQNNYSSSAPSSSSSSQFQRVDTKEDKGKLKDEKAAFCFPFGDEMGTAVDPYCRWDVNPDPYFSFPTIEDVEKGLERALASMENEPPFTDITNAPQQANSSELGEVTTLKQVSADAIADPAPLVTVSNTALESKLRDVSSNAQAVSEKDDEEEGTVANKTGVSEPNGTESPNLGETPPLFPNASVMTSSKATRSVVDNGKRAASLDPRTTQHKDGIPVAPRKRKHSGSVCYGLSGTAKQACRSPVGSSSVETSEGECVGSNEENIGNKSRDRLADNFIFWRFGFTYVYDATSRWSCPFPSSRTLEGKVCQARFDANSIEVHISTHVKAFEENHKGEPLECPLSREDDCKWGSKDRTGNANGPNYGLPRHIRQVHLATRKVACLCGSILSRDTRRELVRHLCQPCHKDDLNKQRAKNPAIPLLPEVNDPLVSEEERDWKKLHPVPRGRTRADEDDKGEGSSKGVKRKRSE